MSTLEFIGVRKRYAGADVLRGIDLTVESGEFLVLLGSSGCGKSTLLNIVAGLIEPTAGDVRIVGRSVLGVHPKDRDIAMVFQSYALYPNMSVARNIGFGLEMRKVPAAVREAAIASVARTLKIEALLERRPSELSGGQRQRVAIGRALVRQPKVFLFDEPLSNLDAKLRMETRIELKRLHQSLGTTVIYVTHDQVEAMTLATRIAVMREGVIEQLGTPAEIYDRPASLFVAGFVGSPPMNLLNAQTAPDGANARLENGSLLPIMPALRPSLLPRQPVIAGIRPERVRLAMPADPGAVPALAEVVELTGPEKLVAFRVGGQALTASLDPRERIEPGDRLHLRLASEDLRWFDPRTGLAARASSLGASAEDAA